MVTRYYELKWFEEDEIEQFRGDNRFWEALLFDENIHDMLAVCAGFEPAFYELFSE